MYSVDSDGLFVFDGNLVQNDILTHYDGATNTGQITVDSVVSSASQWYPSENVVHLGLYIDGIEITESGTFKGSTFDLIESYDVLNPAEYLDILISNVGQLSANPLPKNYLEQLGAIIRYSNDYRFTKGGCNVLFIDWIIMDKIGFERFFPLDVKLMKTDAMGGNVQYYLPKALPLTIGGNTYDYRVPVTFDAPSTQLEWYVDSWENPLLPPDRAIEFVDNGTKRIIGLHHGYVFDQGVACGTNRKDYLTRGWWVYTSRASYNGAIDFKKVGTTPTGATPSTQTYSILQKGQHYGFVCYRKYEDYTDNPSGLISLSQFKVNDRYYIYADFETSGLYELNVPAKWQGKQLSILEKSSNVEVVSSLGVSPILVDVTTTSPIMYGYVVIEIKNTTD